jgi:hypothetical protein
MAKIVTSITEMQMAARMVHYILRVTSSDAQQSQATTSRSSELVFLSNIVYILRSMYILSSLEHTEAVDRLLEQT